VDTIPSALLDRMDVIQLPGYTEEEKLGIAERYLVPRQISEHGLERDRIEIGEAVLRLLAREYTREAGVRGLERRIGDVCRKAAVQVARGREEPIDVTEELELDERWFSRHDVHLHVPAGAIPKDGPSAGIAMATAIASLVRETPVADDVAMTGEITLTGQVLPIGGVRDKVLAAQRAGLGRVILPRENEHDLEELPPETRDALRFVLVDSID